MQTKQQVTHIDEARNKASDESESVFEKDKALFFAHRGASHLAPENTLAAFRLAQKYAVHGTELDLQRCASGELVIFHDETVQRTTNYRELFSLNESSGGPNVRVKDMPWQSLRQLDAGGWKGKQYSGEKVALLEDYLRIIQPHEFLIIEIKHRQVVSNGIEEELISLLKRYEMQDRVLIASFNPVLLRRIRKISKEFPIGLVSRVNNPVHLSRSLWLSILKPEFLLAEFYPEMQAEIEKSHRLGRKVLVWTLDEMDKIREAAESGADGVISNRPELFLELSADLQKRFKEPIPTGDSVSGS